MVSDSRPARPRWFFAVAVVALLGLAALGVGVMVSDLGHRSGTDTRSGSSLLRPQAAVVLANSVTSCNAVTTCTTAAMTTVTGATLLVAVSIATGTGTNSPTSAPSLTFTSRINIVGGAADRTHVWDSENIASGASTTVTIATGGAANSYVIFLALIGGVGVASLDVAGSGTTATSTTGSDTATASQAGDLAFLLVSVVNHAVSTSPTGMALIGTTTVGTAISGGFFQKTVYGAGTYTYSATIGASLQWTAGVILYKLNPTNVQSNTMASCSAVTTCTSTTVNTTAYSTGVVVLSAASGTGPATVSSSPAETWTVRGHIAQSTTAEVYLYTSDNISTATGMTITITFNASTSYTVGFADIPVTTTKSLDGVGAGGTSSGSVTSSDSFTTTVTNDVCVLGVADINSANSATGGDTLLNTVTVSTVVTGGTLWQKDASTGSFTMSASHGNVAWAAMIICLKTAAAPSAPTAITTSGITTTAITVNWNNPNGPTPDEEVLQSTFAAGACGTFSTTYDVGVQAHAFAVTGLTTGSWYCFEVKAANATGLSAASATTGGVQTAHIPPAVTSVVVNPAPGTTTQLNVSWVNDPGFAPLNVTVFYRSGASCAASPSAISVGVGTHTIITGLTTNTQYAVSVQAWNATGAGTLSACVTATTFQTPGAVTSLGTTAQTSTSVSLSWSNPAGTLVNDTIEYILSCPSGAASFTTSATQFSGGVTSAYTVGSLSPGTTYCFDVYAWTGGGSGTLAAPLNVSTLIGVPSAPTHLASTSQTLTTVVLTWTQGVAPNGAITNDTVRVGTTCGTWTSKLSAGNATTYTVTSLTASTVYCFAVTAWDSGGESALSSTLLQATLYAAPAQPTSLTDIAGSHTTITFSWVNHPVANVPAAFTNNTIFYSTTVACGGTLTAVNTVNPVANWTLTGLVAFTSYYVEVTSWSNGGMSVLSACVTMVTQNPTPPTPLNLVVTTTGTTWANLAWSNPTPYILYNNSVYRYDGGVCSGAATTVYNLHGVFQSYNATGLTTAHTYCFTVTAWDGESNMSNPAVTTTLGGGGGGFVFVQSPLTLLLYGSLGVTLILAVWFLVGGKRRRRHDR